MKTFVHRRLVAMSLGLVLQSAVAFAAFAQGLGLAPAQAPEGASGRTTKAAVSAKSQMVVAANPHAAAAGKRILDQGGSAIDAAIATQLVLNLVEPQSSGIGGGGFLLHWSAADRSLKTYDGRETAPAAATPDRFLPRDTFVVDLREVMLGGRPVATPGLLRMLELAHRQHGKLPWAALFAPAIELAESGFDVSPRLHRLIAIDQALSRFEATRRYFYDANGEPLAIGARLRNPELAATFRAIAAGGADAFYAGPLAADIVEAVRGASVNPGDLSLQDLAAYRAREREAVCGSYRQAKICGMGPPSSGGVAVLQILGLLERFDLSRLPPGSADAIHLFAEAGGLAFADRNLYLADSDFVGVPLKGLLDRAYLAERSTLITETKAGPARPKAGSPPQRAGSLQPRLDWRYGSDAALEQPATSHLSVVDRAGNVVSMTSSIEAVFGSRTMVRGFLLNNQLTDFSLKPDEDGRPVANRVEAGKRPRSSMSPTIVFDAAGSPSIALGSPGGAMIINYVAKTLVAMLDWRLDPQAAVNLANFGSLGVGGILLEQGAGIEPVQADLAKRGHRVTLRDETSGLHVIKIEPGRLIGAADPRREGIAVGD